MRGWEASYLLHSIGIKFRGETHSIDLILLNLLLPLLAATVLYSSEPEHHDGCFGRYAWQQLNLVVVQQTTWGSRAVKLDHSEAR